MASSFTFSGIIKRRTKAAILVDTGESEIWIPLSQVLAPEEGDIPQEGEVDLEIPNWLAKAKDLI